MKVPRILLTSGEPAGLGPDLLVKLAQKAWPAELVVIADPHLLQARAERLRLPLQLETFELNAAPKKSEATRLKIIPLALAAPVQPGILNQANAAYVMAMLEKAAHLALNKQVDAIVTAPVQKSLLNEAGFAFSGHTEFFAEQAGVKKVVMLFVMPRGRVALASTHLPLAKVPAALTAESLESSLGVLAQGLRELFQIKDPLLAVCGLNPHAGEKGQLGREEIEIIQPVLEKLRAEKMRLLGPLPADTIFTDKYLNQADAILAMYHDQALPVVKALSFGKAVNVTLGLPFIRTSVDHGTALDVAGTELVDAGSLEEAVKLGIELGGVKSAKGG